MSDQETRASNAPQQPVMVPTYFAQPSDEIDLFELAEQLWRGKFIIVTTVVLALCVGGAVRFLRTPQPGTDYTVAAEFTHTVYPVLAQQNCEGNMGCLNSFANQALAQFIESDWALAGSSLNLITESPLEEAQYEAQLTAVGKALTEQTLADARAELSLINESLNPALLGTERIATSVLNATRVITALESGDSTITFKSVIISPPQDPEQPASKTRIILAMSLILGAVGGAVIVLTRNGFQNRRSKSAA
jgi:uncharacterized protein involved in exopolysaccharide biosynthesis